MTDMELKLQAFLDGELEESALPAIGQLLKEDRSAKGLLEELRQTSNLFKANELSYQVPVSREFYWSQIERSIRSSVRSDPAPGSNASPWAWVWKLFAPAGALALLASLLLPLGIHPRTYLALYEDGDAAGINVHAEFPSSSFVTYRSESEGMSVVWVNTD